MLLPDSPWVGLMRTVNPSQDRPRTIIDTLMNSRSKRDLTKREKEFLEMIEFAEGPMTLSQFKGFWNSLNERQQNDYKMAYIHSK